MKANGYYDGKPKTYEAIKEFPYTYVVECFICDGAELAVKGVFPDGWKRVKQYGYTLCPDCAKKLKDRIENEKRSETTI